MGQTAAQIRKQEKARQRRRAAENWRRWLEELRRKKMQAERDRARHRLRLLALLLLILDSIPVQTFAFLDPAPQPSPAKRPARKSQKKTAAADTGDDDERRYLYDYAPRHGEEALEVYDGLSWNDIIEYNKAYRPWLFPAFKPIPGMPERYRDHTPHIWELLDHIGSAYHRPQAIEALKLIVATSAHDWIDACVAEVGGLTWKDIRRECRRRTPDGSLFEFPRAAERWREQLRREAEEQKKEIKETPENGPKPPSG